MKLSILLVLCFIGTEAKAQTYFDNESTWRFRGSVENWGCCTEDDYMYFVGGDTLLNGQDYKILKRKGYTHSWSCMSHGQCVDTSVHYEVDISLVRQDGEKIYEMPIGDSVEYELYNFDLQVDDSVYVLQNSFFVGQVTAIDSFLVNGEYNKRFVVYDGTHTNYLLEGIGFRDLQTSIINESDLFHQNDYWVLQTQLICYTENGTPYYTKLGEECYFDLGVEELASSVNFIYDIENQIIEVQFTQDSKPQGVLIYNTLAQELNCSGNEYDNAIRFETQAFESGVYFVVVRWENYQESFKVVVAR